MDFELCMELGLKDSADLYELDEYVLGFYRAGMVRRLEREGKLAQMSALKGFF